MRTKDAAAIVYAVFYESFTANNFEPDPPVDLPVERKQPVRSYMLALLNSSAYTKFCEMLASLQVDVSRAKWAVVKRHEFGSAGDQAMGLRFISMRVEQVRARIDELHSKVVEPKQPSELTTADLQTYVTKLRDLLYLTRNYCVGVLARLEMKAASVTSATKPVTPGVSQASYESAPESLPAVRPVVKQQVPASSLLTVRPIVQLL
ncbi:hypothetical protein LPJ76_002902 [Coemansia sp. RSA 638]|nr:hypothetical protein LPJ76_002902 [Coemansia sp. RSA 638]